MSTPSALDHLWNSAQPARGHFDPTRISKLPEPARRYLRHAVAPGAPLASAVRIGMHGDEKLKRWYPFPEFRKRDDAWLMAVDKSWGWGPTNNLCKWFHVCEHESHHTGQIAMLKSRADAKPRNAG